MGPFMTAQMDLELIVLSEKPDRKHQELHDSTRMWDMKFKATKNKTCKHGNLVGT